MAQYPLRTLFLAALLLIGGVWWIGNTAEEEAPIASVSLPALRQDLTIAIKTQGAALVYRDTVQRYRQSDFNEQHNVAHLLGETLYEVEGLEGIQYCDPTFAFGCYHGFFTRAVAAEGIQVVPFLDDACSAIQSGEPSACRHGIGHGILEYLGADNLTDALALCRETTQPNPLAGCTSGVFMEYNVPLVYSDHSGFAVEPRPLGDNPYAPCTSLDEQFSESCYYELPQWWEQVYAADQGTIGALCAALSPRLSKVCFVGYGKVAAPSAFFDPDETRRRCDALVDERGAYLCSASAAWSITLDGGGIADAQRVCTESIAAYGYACPHDDPQFQ